PVLELLGDPLHSDAQGHVSDIPFALYWLELLARLGLVRQIPSANRVLARLFSECDDRGSWSPKSLRTMPKASSPLTAHYVPLEGLAGRPAAIRLPGRPARYRAVEPRALVAQLAAEQGQALDRLSQALRDSSEPVEPESRAAAGARAAANLVMQLVARAEQRVEGVLAAELLRPSLPAWRRARERATLELRVAGEV